MANFEVQTIRIKANIEMRNSEGNLVQCTVDENHPFGVGDPAACQALGAELVKRVEKGLSKSPSKKTTLLEELRKYTTLTPEGRGEFAKVLTSLV